MQIKEIGYLMHVGLNVGMRQKKKQNKTKQTNKKKKEKEKSLSQKKCDERLCEMLFFL